MLSVAGFKAIVFFSFVLETFLFAFVPVLLSNRLKTSIRDRVLGIANAFAGGLFLSAGFIHLLGETHDVLDAEIPGALPFALFLSSLGFLATFFFEKVFFADYHTHDSGDRLLLKNNTDEGEKHYGTSEIISDKEQHKQHIASHPWVPYILLIVLSAHSMISGIAIGVQSNVDSALPLFIAIVSHKWIEAIAVSVSLMRMDLPRKKFLILIIVYTMMEPIGLVIGTVITTFLGKDSTYLIEAVAGAIASGTFIYVATMDIMIEEFSQSKDKYIKALFCTLGYGLMTGLVFLFPHDHEDIHEGGHDYIL